MQPELDNISLPRFELAQPRMNFRATPGKLKFESDQQIGLRITKISSERRSPSKNDDLKVNTQFKESQATMNQM